MKRYRLHPAGDGTLAPVLEEARAPSPLPDEVLVRIKACSLNYRDLLVRASKSASGGAEGLVPLSDGSGTLLSVGANVKGWKEGDPVALTFFENWESGPFDLKYHKAARGGSIDGVLSEQVSVPATSVVRIPEPLSFTEAACLPCAALTAWQALFERGDPLTAGQSLLCLGTGGVSIIAQQLAHAAGAITYITSSSDEKLERALSLGVAAGFNYRTETRWDQSLWERTGKKGVDHVIEVGGPGTLEKSMNLIRAGGTLSLIGVLTGFDPCPASLFPLITRATNLHGIYVGNREMFQRMNAFLERHSIRPVIDRVFPFLEAPAAYDYLASGKHFGKIVIEM